MLPPKPEVEAALRVTNWNRAETAALLGVSVPTVNRAIAKHGLVRPDELEDEPRGRRSRSVGGGLPLVLHFDDEKPLRPYGQGQRKLCVQCRRMHSVRQFEPGSDVCNLHPHRRKQ